jgi:MHS family shikimate/dehydroshikimate transporter-like MFS transporter
MREATHRVGGNDRPATHSEHRSQLRRVVLSSYVGTTIEFYDFLLYGTVASLVFNKLFFTNLDPMTGTIAAFGTFAVGYMARPLGGIICGHFGDRIGRKSMLLLTMSLMGIASFLIGLLPTYAQIGIWAPVLLVALRLLQGIAVGGEWGGAVLMTAEHAGRGRRGLLASITQMGAPSGMVLSTGILALFAGLPEDQFLSWGWRVPFLVSVVLLAVGLFVRLRVYESPLFLQVKSADAVSRRPLLEVLRTHPKNLALATGVGFGVFVAQSLLTAFVIAYAVQVGYARSEVLVALTISSGLAIVGLGVFAALSDRIGRRPVILGGALGMAVAAFPLFALIKSGSAPLLTLALVIGQSILHSSMYGPMAALFTEMFGTRTRYTGASVGYQLSAVLGAGFAPLIAGSLLAATGGTSTSLVSLFLIAACLVTAGSIWFASETRGRDLAENRSALAQPAPRPTHAHV